MGAPSSVERTVLQLLSPRSTLTATGGDFDSSTGLDRLRNQVRIVCQLTLRSFLLTIGVCVRACVTLNPIQDFTPIFLYQWFDIRVLILLLSASNCDSSLHSNHHCASLKTT